MNKKQSLVTFLLAASVVAGLFVSPIQVQEASAAPPSTIVTYVTVSFLNTPPEKMCLGTTAYLTILYKIETFQVAKGGLTPIPSSGKIALYASATGGTILPASAWLSGTKGSGRILATFEATKKGDAKISLYGNFPGATSSFKVVECNWKVKIMADKRDTGQIIEQSIEFHGEGGIKMNNDTGALTGGGTYRFTITRKFQNKDPKLTCEAYSKGTGDSSFSIINGTALGNGLTFGINLASVDIPALEVKCLDGNGDTVEVPPTGGGMVDNPSIPEFSSLSFIDGVTHVPFAFGDGQGEVFLIARKGR